MFHTHLKITIFFYPLKLCIHCYSILLTPNIRQTNARLKNISHKTNGVIKSALNSYLRTSVVNKDSSGCEQVWRWAVAASHQCSIGAARPGPKPPSGHCFHYICPQAIFYLIHIKRGLVRLGKVRLG